MPPRFNYFLGGTEAPTFDEPHKALCSGGVAVEAQLAIDEKLASLGKFFCQGLRSLPSTKISMRAAKTPWPDGKDVCLVAGQIRRTRSRTRCRQRCSNPRAHVK
jgi:hypothetical protein